MDETFMCETWSLTLKEQHRRRVLENKVQRRIFGLKKEEVVGDWRKLHNEKLHNLYSSPSIIRIIKSRRMRWKGMQHKWGDKRNAYRILMGKPEENRPLGRPTREWRNNIEMDLTREWSDPTCRNLP
jgi:hypothetical protein